MEQYSPEQTVQTIYLGILGRAAELSERAFWAEQIDTNPPKLLTDSLLNSAEFVNAFAGQSNEAFVRALHFNFFDRNINQPEVDDWVARIEAEALDQGAIMHAVLDEARARPNWSSSRSSMVTSRPALKVRCFSSTGWQRSSRTRPN